MHRPTISEVSSSTSIEAERGSYVWSIAVVAALAGLLFGYDWVVIGGARQCYEIYFHLTTAALVGWANSCALVGCLLGSLAAGTLGDRYGRRRMLSMAAVLFAVSSVFTAGRTPSQRSSSGAFSAAQPLGRAQMSRRCTSRRSARLRYAVAW